jgi:UDP-N-acetylglucosamine acyltransferase
VSTIHATALVSAEARLADDVTVGPFAIIDGPAVVGPGCVIAPHVWIHGKVELGANNRIGYGSILGADPQDLSFDPASDTGVTLGDNNVLREYVTIHRATRPGAHTTLGNGNYLMTGAHLAHDVILGDRNTLANNVLLAGFVEVGNSVVLAGGSVFHQFIRVGDFAMAQGLTGAGKDVPPYCVLRNTNRLSGLNAIGMRRGGISAQTRMEIKSAYALLFQSGLAPDAALHEADNRAWSDPARKLIEAVRAPSRRGVLTREV